MRKKSVYFHIKQTFSQYSDDLKWVPYILVYEYLIIIYELVYWTLAELKKTKILIKYGGK